MNSIKLMVTLFSRLDSNDQYGGTGGGSMLSMLGNHDGAYMDANVAANEQQVLKRFYNI